MDGPSNLENTVLHSTHIRAHTAPEEVSSSVFLYLTEIVILILMAAFIVTQMIIPAIFGRPMFPWFRRERKIDQSLAEVREDLSVAEGEREVDRTRKEASRIRRRTGGE